MVLFQREYIVKEATQTSDSQTYIKELPDTGLVSALLIRVQATNGSTSNKDSPIFLCVSKIEVIGNGSEVIFSATGEEIIKIAHALEGRRPEELLSEAPNDKQFNVFPIFFGRYIGDSEYGLDLAKWTSVDVRITYDLAAVNAVGATGFVSGSTQISIIAFRALAGTYEPPKGYVKMSEIKSFTSAASGIEEIDLPLAHKYADIFVYCYEKGVDDNTDITAVTLDLDNGKQILYTGEWNDIQEENAKFFKINPHVKGICFKSNTDTFDTWTGTCTKVTLQSGSRDAIDFPTSISGGVVTITSVSNASQDVNEGGTATYTIHDVTTTDHNIYWQAEGIGVGNLVVIPIDLKRDFSGLLNSTDYGSIKLKLEQGGEGATVGVVLREVVTA